MKKEHLVILLKGLLMGVCDVIPGISGGTIAFITGIYERLINGVKNYNPQFVVVLISFILKRDKEKFEELKKRFIALDLLFFIPLGIGICAAFISGAHLIPYLLQNFYAFTMLFFVGLILSSSVLIYNKIESHSGKNISIGILGVIFGIIVACLIPLNTSSNLIYIFVSGALAICAMFLPGISGSYILLILGQYEYMLNALKHFMSYKLEVTVFIIGAVCGMLIISRVISFMLRKFHNQTLYFLLGLVIGSLSMPIGKIYRVFQPGAFNIFFGVLLFIIGFALVLIVSMYARRIGMDD